MKKRITVLSVALFLVVTACGTEGGDTATTSGGDTGTTSGGDTGTTSGGDTGTTSGGDEAMSGVHAAETDLGSILVNGEGFTLYIFTADTDGESTCYDACADLWPPIPGDTEVDASLDAAMFGTTSRTDGSEQLTVNGMPLYLYTPDTEPGDVTGQGFNDVWFVVDPSGSMIEAAAADDVDVDYDYGD